MTAFTLLKVIDTRTKEEGPDDRFHAIPGSGDRRPCDHCGKPIEIHAYVRLADGTIQVWGTGCAGLNAAGIKAQRRTQDAPIDRCCARLCYAKQERNAYTALKYRGSATRYNPLTGRTDTYTAADLDRLIAHFSAEVDAEQATLATLRANRNAPPTI